MSLLSFSEPLQFPYILWNAGTITACSIQRYLREMLLCCVLCSFPQLLVLDSGFFPCKNIHKLSITTWRSHFWVSLVNSRVHVNLWFIFLFTIELPWISAATLLLLRTWDRLTVFNWCFLLSHINFISLLITSPWSFINILHSIDCSIDPAELSTGSLHCQINHLLSYSDNCLLTIFYPGEDLSPYAIVTRFL